MWLCNKNLRGGAEHQQPATGGRSAARVWGAWSFGRRVEGYGRLRLAFPRRARASGRGGAPAHRARPSGEGEARIGPGKICGLRHGQGRRQRLTARSSTSALPCRVPLSKDLKRSRSAHSTLRLAAAGASPAGFPSLTCSGSSRTAPPGSAPRGLSWPEVCWSEQFECAAVRTSALPTSAQSGCAQVRC